MRATIHIATGQYEFLEIEGTIEDIPMLLQAQNQYSEKPVQFSNNRQKLEAFVGGEIYYDNLKHEYTNENGEVYLSGSVYAKQFDKPFDQQHISLAMAKKYSVNQEDIIKMWELKAEISRGLGTALHGAIELFGRYNGLAHTMARSALHDNPMVMKAVEQFFSSHTEEAFYEVLVVDHNTKRAGRIDRLVKTSKGWIIEDFKTDVEITKKLPIYSKQLNFYSSILESSGLPVIGRNINHWNNKWTTYKLDREEV